MFIISGLLSACQPQKGVEDSVLQVKVDQTPTENVTTNEEEVPVEAITFETEIKTEGLSVEEEIKIQEAEEIIKRVVASSEFKDRILNHTVNGIKTFLNNNGYSNEEIYQKILEAAESDNLRKDNKMELSLEVVSQTGQSRIYRILNGIKKVFFFFNLFKKTTPAGIAQSLFQQWLGKIGFNRTENVTSQLSVQEAVSKIIGELGQKLM